MGVAGTVSTKKVSVSGFIPGFSVFVKSPVSVPVSVPVSAPETHRKHRKSLPNGKQQGGAFGAAPRGRRFAPPPWAFVVFKVGVVREPLGGSEVQLRTA